MNSTARTIVVIALLGVALGAGYWLGRGNAGPTPITAPTADAGAPPKPGERKLLYYRNPMLVKTRGIDRAQVRVPSAA